MLELKSVIYDDRPDAAFIAEKETPHTILIYVIVGSVTYWVNGDRLVLKRGDALYIREGTRRAYENHADGHQKYSAHFHLQDQPFLETLQSQPYVYLPLRGQEYYKQRFSKLLLAWFDRREGQSLISEGILLELLGLLVQERQTQDISTPKQELIQTLQTFILHHHTRPLKLTDLAEHVRRSPNHVTKVFKQVLNQTPIHYINQVKISIAQDLLRSHRMTVTEVSDYLGYCELSYFHRLFKRYTGVSPSSLISYGKREQR